jgi:hypothetical protein
MLSVLIVAESSEWPLYKDLEECLLNDFHVEYSERLNSDVAEVNRVEFSYEIIFYLKTPESSEVPAISRLSKRKVFVFLVKQNGHIPLEIEQLFPVADKIVLNAVAMRGRLEYFRGVDRIAAVNAYHLESNSYEIVLNGNRDTRAMIGDIVVRVGKSVIFGIRNDNIAVFSANIFTNEAMREGDNCRFIKNLLESMVGSAELY